MKDLQWFIDRIGKKIYRENNTCECIVCMDVFKNGLIVMSESHAYYLCDCQYELGLIYKEKKEKHGKKKTNKS
jgi:hypothetical protein